MKVGLLNISGAHCGSCVYAIEHVGRKLPGVKEVRVDVNTEKITVEYDGDSVVLDRICELVLRIGHESEVLNRDISDENMKGKG
jgi:Cu+-exporting ATPase